MSPRIVAPSKTHEVLTPANLPYRMRLLVQLLGRRFQDVLDPFDLTPLHWGVLSVLWQQDGQRTQDVAAQLEQLGGTLTVGLDSMQRRGLIRRKRDAKDGRILRIWLTPRAVQLKPKVVTAVRRYIARIFACLSDEELRDLSRLVDVLREHVESQNFTAR